MKNAHKSSQQGYVLKRFCSILRVLKALLKKNKHKTEPKPLTWGCSSAGRAPALHAGGQEFDPPHLHQARV